MVGDSPPNPRPVTVRGVGESHEAVKQTDSGFGVDAPADSGGPLRPDPPLPVRSLPHDLCHGWDLLWWLPAGYGSWGHKESDTT